MTYEPSKTAINPVTGDKLISKNQNEAFLTNYDNVFSKEKEPQDKTMTELFEERLAEAQKKAKENFDKC